MSASVAKVPSPPVGFARHAWWILLVVALTLLGVATARRIARVDAITNSPTWSVDAPSRDAASATGFAHGQRRLIVPGHHNPSFWWIMEAQQAAAEGRLRIRHIDYDSAPDNREVRRTAPYRWWLIAVGWSHGAFTGEPTGYAIERGALFADPLLLALLLSIGAAYTSRFVGPWAAGGFVVGGISLFPLAANFQPGAPDPHSLGWVLAVGSVLPLLVSSRRGGGESRGRVHFAVAGTLGGLAFWNDATTQAPVLFATLLGALGWAWVRRRKVLPVPEPLPWRAWAAAGALTTLGASVFEFAPAHFSWSLDAVNPIHALVWWGTGEILCAAEAWFRKGRDGINRKGLMWVGLAMLALAAWPVTGMVSDSGALLASDFYARELANHPSGGIASSLQAWLQRADSGAKLATVLPALLLVVLLTRILTRRFDREEQGRFVFVFVVSLVALVLGFFQLRWWNLFDGLALVILIVLGAEAEGGNVRTRWRALAATLLVLPGLFVGFPPAVASGEVPDLAPREAQALIERDFSYWIAKRTGAEPAVVYSTPVFSGAAAYYGGFRVVVSSDEDHETGYLTAVRIASASTEQEVSVLLRSRGITHVVLPLWDPVLDQLVRIGRNLPAATTLPPDAFAVALQWWEIPLWMRPMDYLIPNQPHLQGMELRAFALQAEQEVDLGLSRLADFFVERGQLQEAQSLREALTAYPRSVHAVGAMANVDLAVRDQARLKESLDSLIPALSRRTARNLPADRRISLAALFLRVNRVDLAREQLTECLEDLDAAELRTMTPGAVVGLVALSRSLEIPFPDLSLEAVAMELIPPGVRAGLAPK